MSFTDPPTRLTEPELDREKARALQRMVAARNLAIWTADTTASGIYNSAHDGVLRCRTEEEVVRIETAFTDAMTALKNLIEVPRGT